MGSLSVDDLVGLELFLSTVRLGSVSAAAREAHLSQPSATERLHRLESRLGVVLLRRGPGGSAPTPEGEVVAEWARRVQMAVDQMGVAVEAMRTPVDGQPLRVMASLTIAEYVMPRWLHAWRRSGGPLLELSVGNSEAVERAVNEGHTALGFVETTRRISGPQTLAVSGDELTLVVAPSHPWARLRRPLDPAVLAATPLLLRERGSGTRDAFEAALAQVGCEPVEPLAVMGSTTALKFAAAAGDGPCVVSALAVTGELASGTLVTVAVDGVDFRRQFRAIWRASSREHDVRRFLRVITRTSAVPDAPG